MPEPTAASGQQAEDLRLMLQSRGWEPALALIFTYLRQAEASLSPQYPEPVRFDALGRRAMLLDLLAVLYREAELPSPLETYYVQFLGAVTPPTTPPTARPQEPPVAPVPPDPRRLRRQAGSVA